MSDEVTAHGEVFLREHLGAKIEALDRHVTSEIQGLRREALLATENAEKAVTVANTEFKERLAQHNNLIGQMKEQAQDFARKDLVETFKEDTAFRFDRLEGAQNRLMGGIVVAGIVGPLIASALTALVIR